MSRKQIVFDFDVYVLEDAYSNQIEKIEVIVCIERLLN